MSGPGVVINCVAYLQVVAGPTGPAARLLGLLEAGRFTLYGVDSQKVAMIRETP